MNIQLKSKEGEIFNVPLKVIKCASHIMHVLENYQIEGPIPLPRISSLTLHTVITWAEYHKDDPEPIEDGGSDEEEYTEDDLDIWDTKLLNLDLGSLSEIMVAATCMGIRALKDTCEILTKTIKKQKTSMLTTEM